jgi:hypothetical protein
MQKMSNYRSKTLKLLGLVKKIIDEYKGRGKLTLRQIFYCLVAKKAIQNNLRSYKNLSYLLTKARKCGDLPFDVITDRTRLPIKENSWTDVKQFEEEVEKIYRKSKLVKQKNWIEIWLEKDALRGIFEPIANEFDVYLVVCRGYPSISTLWEVKKRWETINKPIFVLYFGDFDPSGEDIFRTIKEKLIKDFGITRRKLHFRKVALTLKDIKKYHLPPAPTKASDSRSRKFIQKYGDFAVELDALPPNVLEEKIRKNIESLVDWRQFQKDLNRERQEAKRLRKLIEKIKA